MMKKAQITLFVIIALIIAIGVLTLLYIKEDVEKKAVEERVDAELVPIQRWVNDCVESVGKEGIRKMALQGGYLKIPGIIANNPSASLIFGNIVSVPYWDYNGENRIPSVGFMEAQLSGYMKENLPLCAGGFAGFENMYNIEAGNMTIKTTISDEKILLDVEYPLTVYLKAGGSAKSMKKFGAIIGARLGRMHKLAQKIMEEEARIYFLENITIDLITMNPKIPFTSLEFGCEPKTWLVKNVEEEAKRMLAATLPRIRVKGTNYPGFEKKLPYYEELREKSAELRTAFEEYDYNSASGSSFESVKASVGFDEDAPEDAYDYFHLFIDVGADDEELKAGFRYDPAWGMRFKALPSRGGIMRSNMARGQRNFFSFLCINQYHFAYDIIYPVMASVRDDSSLSNEGLVFNFAVPVYINDNKADRSDFGKRELEIPEVMDEFCSTLSEEEITITARDTVGEEIKDANIGYRCLNAYCELGKTLFKDSHYRLTTKLPEGCKYPYLYARKEGFLEGSIQHLGEENADIIMRPIKEVPIGAVKQVYSSSSGTFGEAEPLAEDEKVLIVMSLNNGSLDQYIIYPAEKPTVKLAEDGAEYSINAMLIKQGKLIGIKMQPDKMTGGYSNEHLTIGADSAAMASALILHVLEYSPMPARTDETAEMMQYIMDGKYLGKIAPEIR